MSKLPLGKNMNAKPDEHLMLVEGGLPVILVPNGTVATNGTITLGTALPGIFPVAWIYLPAGAVSGGAEGLYFARFSSTTVGVVYADYRAPAAEFKAPMSDAVTPVTGSNSAYTQGTAAGKVLLQVAVPGGFMGGCDHLELFLSFANNNSVGAKTFKANFGSFNVLSASNTTNQSATSQKDVHNIGVKNAQISSPVATLGHGSAGAAPVFGSQDTTQDFFVNITGQIATATDYLILTAYHISVSA